MEEGIIMSSLGVSAQDLRSGMEKKKKEKKHTQDEDEGKKEGAW